jgi:hypothetical protein
MRMLPFSVQGISEPRTGSVSLLEEGNHESKMKKNPD